MQTPPNTPDHLVEDSTYDPAVQYCGPAKMGWLCKIVPKLDFNQDCHWHDVEYEIGGDGADKLMADLLLWVGIIRRSKGQSVRSRVLHCYTGLVCFIAVTHGGLLPGALGREIGNCFRWQSPGARRRYYTLVAVTTALLFSGSLATIYETLQPYWPAILKGIAGVIS